MTAFSFFSYEYGLNQGLALKSQILKEEEQLKLHLAEATRKVGDLRQQLADIRLGGEVDNRANEEVRLTVEQLQEEISQQEEEIGFYKSVMVPNVQSKGLRIERLTVDANTEANKFSYSLLLTQIVDKHDYIQGGVEVSLLGVEGGVDRRLILEELNEKKQAKIGFRFKYFQNIDGELVLPEGFDPVEIMIVAKSSGQRGQRLERKFDWQVNGG